MYFCRFRAIFLLLLAKCNFAAMSFVLAVRKNVDSVYEIFISGYDIFHFLPQFELLPSKIINHKMFSRFFCDESEN